MSSIDCISNRIITQLHTDYSRWAFRMFDKDGSGTIEYEELTDIIITFYDLEGKNKEFGSDKANDIFKLLDENGDGEIDEDEFCNGCSKDEEFYSLIRNGVDKLNSEVERKVNSE